MRWGACRALSPVAGVRLALHDVPLPDPRIHLMHYTPFSLGLSWHQMMGRRECRRTP